MLSWTITAPPYIPTVFSEGKTRWSETETADLVGEEMSSGYASSTSYCSNQTFSNGDQYAYVSQSRVAESAVSLYDSDGVPVLEASGGENTFGVFWTSQSWNGFFSIGASDSVGVSSTLATSSTFSSVFQTTSTHSASVNNLVSTSTATTLLSGSTNSQTQPTTTTASTTSLSSVFVTSSTVVERTTTATRTVAGWSIDGEAGPRLPTISHQTVYKNAGNAIYYSVTSASEGFIQEAATTLSGDFTISSQFTTKPGIVSTLTNAFQLTATATAQSTSSSIASTSKTMASSITVYVGASLPLSSLASSIAMRATTTTAATQSYITNLTNDDGTTYSSDLPTESAVASASSSFVANLDIAETITYITGTTSVSQIAEYATALSLSTVYTSGSSDYNYPRSGSTTQLITENYEWNQTLPTAFNVAVAGQGQKWCGKYYFAAWAAASAFQNPAAAVSANVGSVKMPTTVRGNQTVQAFVGSTAYSSTNGNFTAMADGAVVYVTRQDGSILQTSSAAIQTNGAAAMIAGVAQSTAAGGIDATGNLSVALLPGPHYTSNSTGGASATDMLTGQNTIIGPSDPKTAVLPATKYAGSRGNIWFVSTYRNYNTL